MTIGKGSRAKLDLRDKIICGDAMDILARIPDGTFQTCITSPPYFGLRKYDVPPRAWGGKPDHNHNWKKAAPARQRTARDLEDTEARFATAHVPSRFKGDAGLFCACGAWLGQLGQEPDPDLYCANLVSVFREVWRVLRADGTFWINIADSYWGGNGGRSPGTPAELGEADRVLKNKDLVLIPERLSLALQAAGWWLRSVVIWDKPNAIPAPVTDRPTQSHEYIFFMSKSGKNLYWTHRDKEEGTRKQPDPDYVWSDRANGGQETNLEPDTWKTDLFVDRQGQERKRWRRINLWSGRHYFYDADAIREPYSYAYLQEGRPSGMERGGDAYREKIEKTEGKYTGQKESASAGTSLVGHSGVFKADGSLINHPLGRNKRTVWTIPTEPYLDAHYSTYPRALVEPIILASTSHRACPVCAAPWERRVQVESVWSRRGSSGVVGTASTPLHVMFQERRKRIAHTRGWLPTCDCEGNDGSGKCLVLDPFAGSGTTGAVAKRFQRGWLCIEIKKEYCAQAMERIRKEPVEGNPSQQLYFALEGVTT